jgi:3-oxoacyl-[acyl-carrier protein] reductase
MFSGKTVLVTGASRGIGNAIAIRFAKNRAFVGINHLTNHKKAKVALNEIKKHSDGMLLQGDVGVFSDAKKVCEKLVMHNGKINILVHNAGIYTRNIFDELDEKQWDMIVKTNLKSCYNICKHTIPYMSEGDRIIFISSQLAFKGSSHGADYAASKAGMLGIMKSLSLELAHKNITVNAIAPGTIDTDIIADYTQEQRNKRIKEIPLQKLGKPIDIANACLFLASEQSGYITGETLFVTGGLYLR